MQATRGLARTPMKDYETKWRWFIPITKEVPDKVEKMEFNGEVILAWRKDDLVYIKLIQKK